MTMTDPIADMLTRISNTVRNRGKNVVVLNSKVCRGIADVLKAEGYINGYEVIDDGRQGKIQISLKYGPRGETLIHAGRSYRIAEVRQLVHSQAEHVFTIAPGSKL